MEVLHHAMAVSHTPESLSMKVESSLNNLCAFVAVTQLRPTLASQPAGSMCVRMETASCNATVSVVCVFHVCLPKVHDTVFVVGVELAVPMNSCAKLVSIMALLVLLCVASQVTYVYIKCIHL